MARRSRPTRSGTATSRSASCCSRRCSGLDPQWPDADFDVDEQKQRLADEAPSRVIPTVGVTRYVTPLREGGSLPGIVEADDLGTYVCKFRGAGQGLRVLVAEVIVGGLARRIGLRTPRLVVLDLDPEIARYEADEEVQDLLNASPGLNLGIDFLPGAFGYDGELARRGRRRRRGCCGWTRSAPTSTAPGATPTCCSGTATCG